MMNRLRNVAIAFLCSALLSACYQSAAPLIAPGAADFPFGARLRYTAFEWNIEMRQWEPSEPGSTSREGDHYVQTADGSTPGDVTPFTLKSIGDGFYIGQEEADSHYTYDLLKIEGDTVYEYALSCSESDQTFVVQGLIDAIAMEGVVGNICTVSSLDKLARVFRAVAESRQPKAKFVIQRP
jgi:hypothetical protein